MPLSEVVPPASWTIVMASGVIAIDLYDVHLLVLSTIMLGFAAAVWLLLAGWCWACRCSSDAAGSGA